MSIERDQVLEILRPGVIMYLEKNLPPGSTIPTRSYGPLTRELLIISIESNNSIGRKFINELFEWGDEEFLMNNFIMPAIERNKKKKLVKNIWEEYWMLIIPCLIILFGLLCVITQLYMFFARIVLVLIIISVITYHARKTIK